MAHPTPAAKDAHATQPHVEHIWSWAPIVIGFATPFFLLALLWPTVALPIGLVIGAIGLGKWFQEDIKRFKRGSFGHHAHGQPGPLLGTILFIGTEVLIFGGIFAVWFVGKAQLGAEWGMHEGEPIHLPIVATAINTAILVASGGTLHWGYMRLNKNDHRGFRIGLVLTILLGAAFLAQQVNEYLSLIAEGVTIKGESVGLFGSAFYMLTGTHGLHVAGGLFVLILVLFRALKSTQTKEHHILLETAAIYWHFVDVVWLFLFVVVYLGWL